MDLEEIKAFLNKHPEVEVEKPGLFIFLTDVGWRIDYPLMMHEAEHLAKIKFSSSMNADPLVWARELLLFRKNRK